MVAKWRRSHHGYEPPLSPRRASLLVDLPVASAPLTCGCTVGEEDRGGTVPADEWKEGFFFSGTSRVAQWIKRLTDSGTDPACTFSGHLVTLGTRRGTHLAHSAVGIRNCTHRVGRGGKGELSGALQQ